MGGAQPDEQVGPGGGLQLGPGQLERLGEPPRRLVGSEPGEGRVAGTPGVLDGLVGIGRARGEDEVAGDLAHPVLRGRLQPLLERLGDRPVQAAPPGSAQIVVEGLLDQAVSEAVAAGTHLSDQCRTLRRIEQVEQFVLPDREDLGEDLEVEVATDHRRRREEPDPRLADATDSGGDHLPDALGERDVAMLVDRPAAGGAAGQRARLGQVPEDLGDEERVPVGLVQQGVGESDLAAFELAPDHRLHEGVDPHVVETPEVEHRHSRLATECAEGPRQRMGRRQLGVAVGPGDQEPGGALVGDDVAQELQGRLVRPVQVVEDEHGAAVTAQGVQQPHHRCEEHVALGVGVRGPRRRHGAEPLGHAADEPPQSAAELLDVGRQQPLVGVGHVVAERFDEGLVGNGQFLVGAPEQHHHPRAVGPARRLGHQRGLPLAGFPGDEQDLAALAGGHPLDGQVEQREFERPPDDADPRAPAEPRREGDPARGGDGAGGPTQPERLHRLGQSLQLESPERGELVATPAADDRSCQPRDQDLAPLGEGTETGGLDHGVAEVVALFGGHLAGADRDPEAHRLIGAPVLVVHRLLHRERAGERARGRREHRHHPVTQVLNLDAPGRGDCLTKQCEVGATKLVSPLGGQAPGQLG